MEPYNAYVFTIHSYKGAKYSNASMSAVFTEIDLPSLAVDLPSYLYNAPINLNQEITMSMGYSPDKA